MQILCAVLAADRIKGVPSDIATTLDELFLFIRALWSSLLLHWIEQQLLYKFIFRCLLVFFIVPKISRNFLNPQMKLWTFWNFEISKNWNFEGKAGCVDLLFQANFVQKRKLSNSTKWNESFQKANCVRKGVIRKSHKLALFQHQFVFIADQKKINSNYM